MEWFTHIGPESGLRSSVVASIVCIEHIYFYFLKLTDLAPIPKIWYSEIFN